MPVELGILTQQRTSTASKWSNVKQPGLWKTTTTTQLVLHPCIDGLGWSNLSNRRKSSRLCSFYKAYNRLSPISLDHLAQPSRSTRSTTDGSCFLNHTDAFKFSLFPRIIVEWNALSPSRRLKPTVLPWHASSNGLCAHRWYQTEEPKIYLDFQKAFDKVPHKRLMMKINAMVASRRPVRPSRAKIFVRQKFRRWQIRQIK